MVQDRAIVTMADQYKLVHGLSIHIIHGCLYAIRIATIVVHFYRASAH